MKSFLSVLFVAALLSGMAPALAQPAPDSPVPQSDPAEEPAPESSTPSPSSDPALQKIYERGFAALTHGQFAVAIQAFDQVALQASDPAMRGSARELARLARRYLDSGTRFARGAGPGLVAQARAQTPAPDKKRESADDAPNAGRAEFVVATTLASFYTGFALNVLLDVDDFRTGTLLVTAATAGGFVASLQGSKGRRMTGGMASAYSLGIGLGLSNGLLLASPFGLAEDADLFVSSGLIGMIAGGATGLVLADKAQPTRGQVSFISTATMLGVSTVGLSLVIAEPDISGDAALTLIALGIDAGALAGILLSPDIKWSTSRASLVGLSAFLGAVGGFGGMALIAGTPDDDTDAKLFAGSVLAGVWGGFALGVHFTKDMSADTRFASDTEMPVAVLPTLVGDSPGIAIMGSL